MDRRKSLKFLAAGALASGAFITGCNTEDEKKVEANTDHKFALDRNADELQYENKLLAEAAFFTPHEMATITILTDIIIPKDDISGNASQAKVPEFIEFIVKDIPKHQIPMKGGLRWLDMQCLNRYQKPFKDCTVQQQIEMIDLIAYPERAKKKKELTQGVAFFSLIRNLTVTGFYTSEMGVKDLGYAGNTPNQWNGVPIEVLKQYNVNYSEKENKECVKF
jgi:gluconate 2-dehydrogenase gamma chain